MNAGIKDYFALPIEITGSVQLSISLSAPVSIENLNELAVLIENFFRLADRGAFVVETYNACDAIFRVTGKHQHATGFDWICDTKAIDHRISQVLRNDMVMFNQLYHPVDNIRMHSITTSQLSGGPLPYLDLRNPSDVYPPLCGNLPFTICFEPLEDHRKSARAEIEFTEPISDSTLVQILDLLELWADVSLGAYGETETDVITGKCAIFDAIPDITDDYTIEMPIEYFGAVEDAWNSLLNLCGYIDSDIARLSKVTIE